MPHVQRRSGPPPQEKRRNVSAYKESNADIFHDFYINSAKEREQRINQDIDLDPEDETWVKMVYKFYDDKTNFDYCNIDQLWGDWENSKCKFENDFENYGQEPTYEKKPYYIELMNKKHSVKSIENRKKFRHQAKYDPLGHREKLLKGKRDIPHTEVEEEGEFYGGKRRCKSRRKVVRRKKSRRRRMTKRR
jgi:hypothetical protein